jgi:hypothetical protein
MATNDYSLEQLNGIVSLTEALARNPETREAYLRLTKKVLPNAPIPEIDAKDQIVRALEAERIERKKLEDRIQERDLREKIDKDRSLVRAKYSLTDDDMTSVEQLMVDKGIPNFETGAEYFTMSKKTAQPTASAVFGREKMKLPGSDIWGKGMFDRGALRDIALDEAYKAFDEIQGKK